MSMRLTAYQITKSIPQKKLVMRDWKQLLVPADIAKLKKVFRELHDKRVNDLGFELSRL